MCDHDASAQAIIIARHKQLLTALRSLCWYYWYLRLYQAWLPWFSSHRINSTFTTPHGLHASIAKTMHICHHISFQQPSCVWGQSCIVCSGPEEGIFEWSGQLTLSITHTHSMWLVGGSGGKLPQENFWILGRPQRWLLVSFRGKGGPSKVDIKQLIDIHKMDTVTE